MTFTAADSTVCTVSFCHMETELPDTQELAALVTWLLLGSHSEKLASITRRLGENMEKHGESVLTHCSFT